MLQKGYDNSMKKLPEPGFVSIFSVLIIMAILTLVMVGFSQIVRRAATTNLNDQLSTQAFYAAESGVNAVVSYLKSAGPGAVDKAECKGPIGNGTFFKYNDLDPSVNIGYSCVLFNTATRDINLSSVPVIGTAAPKMVPLESNSAGNPIRSFDITLATTSDTRNVPTMSADAFEPQSSRATADVLGTLRLDLVPTDGSLDRAALAAGTYSFFVDFRNNGPPVGATTVRRGVNSGELVRAKCRPSDAKCTATINLESPGQKYMMRFQAVYQPVKVVVDNITGSTGPVVLSNGQKIVDVTGQSNSVFRRIQVRLQSESNLSSAFSIESADTICKKLQVAPGDTQDPTCGIN